MQSARLGLSVMAGLLCTQERHTVDMDRRATRCQKRNHVLVTLLRSATDTPPINIRRCGYKPH
eukprot:5252931-Amphidinium_carterae.1